MKISVIVPFLNEAENLRNFQQILSDYLKGQIYTYKLEVIFVNDGSSDNSVEILKNNKIKDVESKIVSLSKNFGSHSALRAGIFNSTGDFIMFLYADLQDPINLIGCLVEKLTEGVEIIWANRRNTKSKLSERLFSSWYSKLMKQFAISNYPEKGFDVVMFSRKVANTLNNDIQVNSSIFLQILSFGYKQDFIEYDKIQRKNGKSKWTISKKIKLLIDSFVAFSFAPIRLVTIVGFTLFLGGIFFSAYLLFRKVFFHDLVSGWTMLMTTLSLGFGITNISLGIIAEYLWRTFDAARGRPAFIIDEIIDLNNE